MIGRPNDVVRSPEYTYIVTNGLHHDLSRRMPPVPSGNRVRLLLELLRHPHFRHHTRSHADRRCHGPFETVCSFFEMNSAPRGDPPPVRPHRSLIGRLVYTVTQNKAWRKICGPNGSPL